MHNIIFPLKDTTIYSKYPEVNTGLDEILEISKEISSSNYIYRGIWSSGVYYRRYDYVSSSNGNGYYYTVAENVSQETSSAYWVSFDPTTSNENSRILIKFDTASFDSKAYQSASVVYLNLFTSIARKVPTEYTLEAHPISGSWEMGVGNFTDKSTTRGATWTRNTSETNWSASGGDSTGSMASQDFNFVPTDVRMDVTNIFFEWTSSNFLNQGFLIKRPTAQENDNISYGSLSFYSLDTHTVYLPTLEVAYDDHIYNTSSFYVWNVSGSVTSVTGSVSGSLLSSGSIAVTMKRFKPEYKYNTTVRFRIDVKPSYVAKTFYEELRQGNVYYLPDSASYSIRDAYSNRIMIPFSDYTKISVDETGHYFDVSLSGFMPERFYKTLFKVVMDGETQYFDSDNQFKVVK